MGKEDKRVPNEREQAISEVLGQPGVAEGLREYLKPPETPAGPSSDSGDEMSHEEMLEEFRESVKGIFDRLENEYPDVMRIFKNNPGESSTSDPQ